MSKRVLILGASGQDGLILSRALSNDGFSVVGACRSKEGLSTFTKYAPNAGGKVLDIRNFKDVLGIICETEPHVIYNLAAVSSVHESWAKPQEVFDINLLGALNVFESVRLSGLPGTKVYQASSSEMFGGGAGQLSERSPFFPKSPYAVSKLAAHNLTMMYRESYGVFASSGILFNHESPLRSENFVSRRVSKQAAEIYQGIRGKIEVGNLESSRDWGWAPDYVQAMRLIMDAADPGDFIVSSGDSKTIAELVQAALSAIGLHDWENYVAIDTTYRRPNDPNRSVGNSAKIRKELGWLPSKSFEDMVSEMVRYDISLIETSGESEIFWSPG